MLYLEDYLEMIEHLPQELRDRFTEMRELDLAVQNNMDSLDKKSRLFFQQCKRGELQHDSLDTEFHSLRREYFKVMEDADEKVAIATQIHELVERYLRRLDSELFKFKCELEADNNGITEILEKRSLELDGHNSTAATALLLSINQKENRYYGGSSSSANSLLSAGSGLNNTVGGITSSSNLSSSPAVTGNTSATNTAASASLNALCSLSPAQLLVNTTASHHPRHKKLEKRRETICTVPVQEKRANLNHSLPTVSNSGTNSSSGSSSGNVINSTAAACNGGNYLTSIIANVATLPLQSGVNSSSTSSASNQASGAAGAAAASNSSSVGHLASAGFSVINRNAAAVASGAVSNPINTSANSAVTYNLPQLGGGASASSAIAAAASQAIVATQQMQQGRRTASLKASYEAIHGAAVAGGNEFWSAANVATQSSLQTAANNSLGHHHQHHHHQQQQHHPQQHGQGHAQQQQQQPEKKQKKKLNSSISLPGGIAVQPLGNSSSGNSITSSSSSLSVDSMDLLSSNATAQALNSLAAAHSSLSSHLNNTVAAGGGATAAAAASVASAVVASAAAAAVAAGLTVQANSVSLGLPSAVLAPGSNLTISENGLIVEQTNEGEWSYDPNEPRYCTCNQVSYGDMVACDNDACPYEWFHYPCVGITQPPKGKWYCPKCTASMRRRGNRKN